MAHRFAQVWIWLRSWNSRVKCRYHSKKISTVREYHNKKGQRSLMSRHEERQGDVGQQGNVVDTNQQRMFQEALKKLWISVGRAEPTDIIFQLGLGPDLLEHKQRSLRGWWHGLSLIMSSAAIVLRGLKGTKECGDNSALIISKNINNNAFNYRYKNEKYFTWKNFFNALLLIRLIFRQ